MRSLKRNKQKMWYATYEAETPILDDDGFDTGETTAGYSEPVVFYANISPAKGSSDQRVFGVNLDYTKSICTTDMTLPISETSRIWFETTPEAEDKSDADYSVVRIARSLNNVVYAIKKLSKSAGELYA